MLYQAKLHVDPFRARCNEHGWSVADFAAEAGIGESTVYRVLGGETPPSAGFISACAVLFGVDAIGVLFSFTRAPFAPVLARRSTRRGALA